MKLSVKLSVNVRVDQQIQKSLEMTVFYPRVDLTVDLRKYEMTVFHKVLK